MHEASNLVKTWGSDPVSLWRAGTPALILHDAGAASHAYAWMTTAGHGRPPSRVYAAGPALRLAAIEGVPVVGTLDRALDGASWALVGTGWQSDLEQRAMRHCADLGIHCVAIVDHWVNYMERFSELDERHKPNTVVVTDPIAEQLARRQLPWADVTLWPNAQAQALRRAIAEMRLGRGNNDNYLLWLNEPLRFADGRVVDPLVEPGYSEHLWGAIERVAKETFATRIIVRTHPSQTIADYGKLPFHVDVHASSSVALASDLAGATLCLGLNTYALYLANQAGIPSASMSRAVGLRSEIPSSLVPQMP